MPVLDEHLPPSATGLVVAVSGGADSACLLIAALADASAAARFARCTSIMDCRPPPPRFARPAGALCDGLNVPLTVIAVTVETGRRFARGRGARRPLRRPRR